MRANFKKLRNKPSFRMAIIVPIAIMFIFSFFNLVAVPDPSRVISNAKYGIVVESQDANVAGVDRLLEAVKSAFPFSSINYADRNAAANALATGEVLANLVLPSNFGAQLSLAQTAEIEIKSVSHLTLIENQLSAQISSGLQAAIGGAVLAQQLAAITGEPPRPLIDAALKNTVAPVNPTAMAAPGIAVFVIWLAAFVGSLLIFLTVRGEGSGKAVTIFRIAVPLVVTGLASFALAAVISLLIGEGSLFLKLWSLVWLTLLGLSWLFSGLFAWLGPVAVVIIMPVVFLQNALGGAFAPIGSMPDWLQSISQFLPFHVVGESLRATIILGDLQLPLQPALTAMAIGVFLIISRGILGRK